MAAATTRWGGPASTIAAEFLKRELRSRFLGSFSGGLWAILAPLIQLGVYSFVFTRVFAVRLPEAGGSGYVPFLAVALWPWIAFSESVLRSTTVIEDNAALIGKVALPRVLLVGTRVAASFLIHAAGFVTIVVLLALAGQGIRLGGLLPALALFVPLFALALGCALLAAAVQVFVRDLVQVLAQVLMLLMYAAPIFYDRTLVPPRFREWLGWNPFTFYAESIRSLLLDRGGFGVVGLTVAIGVALAVLAVGFAVFRRLDPHFEDFL